MRGLISKEKNTILKDFSEIITDWQGDNLIGGDETGTLSTELTGHGDKQRGANPRKPLGLGKAYVKP